MKNTPKYIIGIALVLVTLLALWFLVAADWFADETIKPMTELQQMADECAAISEKSVAHMVAVVEFQKLEIAGRQMRVLRNCMNDHGFYENAAWVNYATPIAQTKAKTEHISFDEALENLKRTKMRVLTKVENEPEFWVKAQQDK